MATIKDVAREAGLTVGTVSRVLNNRGYISEKTRNKVYEVMKELGYQPNAVARSLSKQKSDNIGVIVPHIMHPYFAKMISSIERAVAKQNYNLLLYNSKGDVDKQSHYLDMCKGNRVAGILMFSDEINPDRVLELGIPVISIEREIENSTASVVCDNYEGGKLAAKHLMENGCRNVLMFGGIFSRKKPADDREIGFMEICKEYNIRANVIKSYQEDYNDMDYIKYIEEALQKHREVDGIFASSDLIAAQVIRVVQSMGKEIPGDIKLIGFDDVNLAELTYPSITTIHQPIKEMAELAVDYLIKASNNDLIPKKTILPIHLVIRESA